MDYVFKLWQDSDAKERGILLLTFAPMFLCMIGLIFSIVHFVLFILPSFLFSILGWGMLTALFGSGGKYCYKYFTGKEVKAKISKDVIDVSFSEDTESDSDSDSEFKEPEAPKKSSSRKRNAQ